MPVNVTLFGNEVFIEIIKLNQVKMWSYQTRVGPNLVTCIFIKERRGRFGRRDTGAYRGKVHKTTEAESGSDVNQETSRIASKPPELGKTREQSSLELSQGAWPC